MKKKNILTLNLVIVALMMPNNIFAKEFKDVKRSGNVAWAYEYIDELSDKNILKGYEDGSFKPNNAVSFLETMEIIKTIKNPSKDTLNDAVNKNVELLNANGVPSWARDAVAFNIEEGTITEKTLAEAKKRGFIESRVYPNRNSIAVYFARAFKINESTDTSNLKYTDIDKIAPMTLKYLPELVNAKIFSATGSDGLFNGNKAIRRSEMAAITSRTLRWTEDNSSVIEDDNSAGESLIPDDEKKPIEDNTADDMSNNEGEIKDDLGESIINDDSSKDMPVEEKETNETVNFSGEVTDILDGGSVKYLKVRIRETDNSNFAKDNIITIHTSRVYKIGDIVSGSGNLKNNSLMDIKLN